MRKGLKVCEEPVTRHTLSSHYLENVGEGKIEEEAIWVRIESTKN